MLIEMFGLPGAGKTYYAREFIPRNNAKILKKNSRFTRLILFIMFVIIRPLFSTFIIKNIIKENEFGKRNLKHKLKIILTKFFSKCVKIKFYKDVLIGEGIFQLILGIYDREITNDDLKPYLKYISKNRIIYIIEAKMDTRLMRIRKRNRIPRENILSEMQLKTFYLILEKNYIIIKNFIVNNYEHKIIQNDI